MQKMYFWKPLDYPLPRNIFFSHKIIRRYNILRKEHLWFFYALEIRSAFSFLSQYTDSCTRCPIKLPSFVFIKIVHNNLQSSYTSGFMKMVSVYTLLVNTIYPSRSTQIAEGTFLRKRTEVFVVPWHKILLYTVYRHYSDSKPTKHS